MRDNIRGTIADRSMDAALGIEPASLHAIGTTPATADVLRAISVERRRQDGRWGEQNHPGIVTGLLVQHPLAVVLVASLLAVGFGLLAACGSMTPEDWAE